MSHELFKVIHILGVLMVFSGLAAQWGVCAQGSQPRATTRIFLSILHGLGLLVLPITGFAMLAKLGWTSSIPIWAISKIAIWVLLGASLVFAKRKPNWGLVLVTSWLALGTAAAYLAIYKPQ